MKMKYKVTLLSITVLLISSIMLGTSYSLWTTTATQKGENIVNVGCFQITYTDTGFADAGTINLANQYPITESAGASKQPYKFTIKNECSVAASYNVNLETLTGSTMNTNYLRVKFNDNQSVIYEDGLSSTTPYLGEDATSARRLITGYLADGESVTYSLRLWIDYSAETTTTNVMGTTFLGKVVVYSQATKTQNPGVEYSGDGDRFTSFMANNFENTVITGVDPSNYVSFNGELWRVYTHSINGVGLVKATPIDGYTFDYDNLSNYSTSPFIKTVTENNVDTTVNYYDTLSATAKEMIDPLDYYVGTIADNNGNVSSVSSSVASSTHSLKVGTLDVISYIYSNSDSTCSSYSFANDLNTIKCANTSYLIGNDYVYSITHGPNGLYILSNRGIKEEANVSNVKIIPAVYLKASILITGGSGTSSDPYTIAMPEVTDQ